MADRRILTPDVFRQLLHYDPMTGLFRWLERGVEWFPDSYHPAQAYCDIWNAQHAHLEALTQRNTAGYRVGSVLDIKIMAHRVAYSMQTGIHIQDIDQIDHINGVKDDNRIVNLRMVSCSGNGKNTKLSARNKSGHQGVIWDISRGQWMSFITNEGLRRTLGRFYTFEEAVTARKAAEARLGFHENHGRPA